MRNKKTSGAETLVNVIIVVVLVLSLHSLFSDSPPPGSSEDQYQDEPW